MFETKHEPPIWARILPLSPLPHEAPRIGPRIGLNNGPGDRPVELAPGLLGAELQRFDFRIAHRQLHLCESFLASDAGLIHDVLLVLRFRPCSRKRQAPCNRSKSCWLIVYKFEHWDALYNATYFLPWLFSKSVALSETYSNLKLTMPSAQDVTHLLRTLWLTYTMYRTHETRPLNTADLFFSLDHPIDTLCNRERLLNRVSTKRLSALETSPARC